ncbi:indigoidine synthase A-like protein [Crepidotus variabilis]|uniref:Indigoidine synthase A-like protein n=1 Tax=Crepidotus variabilis TaxID=179855 RepID=A0A9P6EUW6_9AGAR|nr:indigoidine synthase A-like protein [Crepidotus variabilis]
MFILPQTLGRTCTRRGLSTIPQRASIIGQNLPVDIHPEVEEALAHNKPVVALETALVTHGLPHPASLDVPVKLEKIVRSQGSIPATIGLVGGRVKIGLERNELERLADRRGRPAKISRRDIAAAIATGRDGGTTCSATLVFAALAGIKVFATGGLGGVHRGGENSLDISADLQELARCPVGLVSSGVKSILDIKRTLEYLETLGVPVISYSKTKEFPAFFSRHSGHNVPWNMDDPLTAAKLLYTQNQLGLQNGALIAVPIPEEHEAAGKEIQKLVDQAVRESEENGANRLGNDTTPWLLDRIAKLSQGRSLTNNIALLENTAVVGGQIAVEYQKLAGKESPRMNPSSSFRNYSVSLLGVQQNLVQSSSNSSQIPPAAIVPHPSDANVIIVGCAAVDVTAQETVGLSPELAKHSTTPGRVNLSLGGVGRNIAEATHRVMKAKFPGLSSLLLAPIGEDPFAQIISSGLQTSGMRTDGLITFVDEDTAVCNMVLDGQGGLVGGVADMKINEKITADAIIPHLTKHVPSLVALDGNITPATLQALVAYCNEHRLKVLFEPTSVIKSNSVLPAVAAALKEEYLGAPITYCTPNLLELNQLYEMAQSEQYGLMESQSWWSVVDSLNLGTAFRMELEQLSRRPITETNSRPGNTLSFLVEQGVAQKAIHLLPFFQHLIIKCGDQGVLVVMNISPLDAATSGWKNEKSNPRQRHIVATGKSGEIIVIQHFPPLPVEAVMNVTGAGDSFVGALLATLANSPAAPYNPKTLNEAVSTAQKAAVLTLQSPFAVSPLLSIMSAA